MINCPVCGKQTMDSNRICSHCQWEYNGITKENAYSDCNRATIAAYRKANL